MYSIVHHRCLTLSVWVLLNYSNNPNWGKSGGELSRSPLSFIKSEKEWFCRKAPFHGTMGGTNLCQHGGIRIGIRGSHSMIRRGKSGRGWVGGLGGETVDSLLFHPTSWTSLQKALYSRKQVSFHFSDWSQVHGVLFRESPHISHIVAVGWKPCVSKNTNPISEKEKKRKKKSL